MFVSQVLENHWFLKVVFQKASKTHKNGSVPTPRRQLATNRVEHHMDPKISTRTLIEIKWNFTVSEKKLKTQLKSRRSRMQDMGCLLDIIPRFQVWGVRVWGSTSCFWPQTGSPSKILGYLYGRIVQSHEADLLELFLALKTIKIE